MTTPPRKSVPARETTPVRPFTERIEIARGPNTEGHSAQTIAAQAIEPATTPDAEAR